MSVADALAGVRERIRAAARAAGRDPGDITLVAVTKTVPLDRIRDALGAGELDLGENRAQELLDKAEALRPTFPELRWHFIGRLQRNKVRSLAPHVALWQSVDRGPLAAEIARHAPGARVLVQVNVAREARKGGCAPEDVPGLLAECRALGLDVAGLMTIPPLEGDPTPVFAGLRRLTDESGLATCSMGMSGDFERAIAAGSTMVRVGSAIFGPRPAGPDARR